MGKGTGEDGMTDSDALAPATMPAIVRTYAEELSDTTRINDTCYAIQPGFVPNMRVPGVFFVNERLSSLMFDELKQFIQAGGVGGFIPAMKQIANVAGLPGVVGVCPSPPPLPTSYRTKAHAAPGR